MKPRRCCDTGDHEGRHGDHGLSYVNLLSQDEVMPSVESLSVCLCSSRCDLGTSILHKVRQPHSHTYLMPARADIPCRTARATVCPLFFQCVCRVVGRLTRHSFWSVKLIQILPMALLAWS